LLSTRHADGSGIYAVIDSCEQLLDLAESDARLGAFQRNGIAETDLWAIQPLPRSFLVTVKHGDCLGQ
jgi:hypothetical protein